MTRAVSASRYRPPLPPAPLLRDAHSRAAAIKLTDVSAPQVSRLGQELRKAQAEGAKLRAELAQSRGVGEEATERARVAAEQVLELERQLREAWDEIARLRRELEKLRVPKAEMRSGFGEFVHLRREVSALKQALDGRGQAAPEGRADGRADADASRGSSRGCDMGWESVRGVDAAAGGPQGDAAAARKHERPLLSARAAKPPSVGSAAGATGAVLPPPVPFARGKTSMLQSALQASAAMRD